MVYEEIMKEKTFLQRVVSRISSPDLESAELSFGLLNVLFKGSIELKDTRLVDELERLNVLTIIGVSFFLFLLTRVSISLTQLLNQ